jgi:hypothetical protein
VSRSTAGSYTRAARRYIAFAAERGLDPQARASLDAYLGALADGVVAAGTSEPAMARAAFRWLQQGT